MEEERDEGEYDPSSGEEGQACEDDEWFLRTLEKELEDELEEDLEKNETEGAPLASSGAKPGAQSVPGLNAVVVDRCARSDGEVVPKASTSGAAEGVALEATRKALKRPVRSRKRKATADNLAASKVRAPHRAMPSLVLTDAQGDPKQQSGIGNVASETCPPHPGFLRGLCIRCGELQKVEDSSAGGEPRSISMRYLHSDLEINKEYVRELKLREASRLIAQKKLTLVFDLDHTLLNSSHKKDITEKDMPLLDEVVAKEVEVFRGFETKNMTVPPGSQTLFHLQHIQMWTKLRPYYHQVLEEASKLFDLHVYTMGERGYAEEMVKLLDPDKSFFGDHIVSKNDSTSNSVKDLDVLIGTEKSVLILDDSPKVWHRHRANVLEVERYHFFPSSLKHFHIRGKCLLERKNDENSKFGPLASVLKVLKEIHKEYFSNTEPGETDVREILKARKKRVLAGCNICFGKMFPEGGAPEHLERHPLWKLSEEFGAVCTRLLDDGVTHVVSSTDIALGQTAKAVVVKPQWIYASAYHFARAREERYRPQEKARDNKG